MGGNLRPELRCFLGDGTSDSAAFGFSFIVDNNSGIILAVEESAVGSVPGSALANDDGGVNFLSEFLDSLFA